ncbi:MAG: hypothetical protein GYA60_05600 [Candidatus Methanofastidiosa archaeon]|nr:hypothetical protein [Candidatus Methanofastidiosa archaeon]
MAIYVTRWIKTDPIEGVNRIYGLNQLMADDIVKCLGYSAKVIKYRDNEYSCHKYCVEVPSGLFMIFGRGDKIEILLNYPSQQLVYMMEKV